MNHLDKNTQAGFTLVEVMIAIGIMTVGSLGHPGDAPGCEPSEPRRRSK